MDESEVETSHVFIKLKEIDSEAQKYLQMLNLKKSLKFCDKAIQMRFEFYGISNNETIRYLRDVLRLYTMASLRLLDANQIENSAESLKKLEEFAFMTGDPSNFIPEKCGLFNAFAAVYKKMEKFRLAQKYLDKAVNLGAVFRDQPMDLATTHIMMCVV
jgi:tetratricopeptide (TPR) repeat protein